MTRRIKNVTTLVPLALGNVTAVLDCISKMVRGIAQKYGGWGKLVAGKRLLHKVTVHLISKGTFAMGDE